MARKQGKPRKPPVPPGTGPVPAGPGSAVGGLPSLPVSETTLASLLSNLIKKNHNRSVVAYQCMDYCRITFSL